MQDTAQAEACVESSTSTDEQWEYCTLQQTSLRATLTYCGDGQTARNVPYIAWELAIASLGRGGWEMAGVTATVMTGGIASGSVTTLYFKRRVLPSRAISEPALVL